MQSTGVVLIADDNEENLRLCARTLRAAGYDVHTTSNGEEAIARTRATRPNVVFVDVDMPGMDGNEVCRRLKGDAGTYHIPVVMLTRRRLSDASLGDFDPHADECLAKPFHLAELLARARMAVSTARTREAIHALRARALGRSKRVVAEVALDYKPTDLNGRQIGAYHLLRPLSRGGLARVYLARHQVLGTKATVKLLPAALVDVDPDQLSRFLRGARVVAQLDHANIVSVLDAGREQDYYYLARKFVEGESARDLLLREGRLSLARALSIAIDTAEALVAAHAARIVHRDVKPSNVIVTPSGQARLTDFGLARPLGPTSISTTGLIVGTPDYMSPEQCDGEFLDARADIYSLGATLYHLLTGRLPAEADTPIAVLRKQVEEIPPSLVEISADIPAPLSELVDRMLAKDKASRPASAREVADGLRRMREE